MLISKTINSALRILGVLSEEEEATPAQAQDAVNSLNGMIEAFTNESLIIPHNEIKSYTKPVGGWSNAVTIGSGEQIDETAPTEILTAFFRDAGGSDFQLKPFSFNQWADIRTKNTIARPISFFYETNIRSIKIYFDTIPYAEDTLKLVAKMPFDTIYKVTDDVAWDYGYERMIRYNLAIELASEYGSSLNDSLVAIATNSKAHIKRMNASIPMLNMDIALQNRRSRRYDIRGDY